MIDLEKLRAHLENMTDEEIKHFFPESTTPKGWVDIEDELPMWMALDVADGCTKYKVKFSDGSEGDTYVSDHNTWYVYAKHAGITHWFNE